MALKCPTSGAYLLSDMCPVCPVSRSLTKEESAIKWGKGAEREERGKKAKKGKERNLQIVAASKMNFRVAAEVE